MARIYWMGSFHPEGSQQQLASAARLLRLMAEDGVVDPYLCHWLADRIDCESDAPTKFEVCWKNKNRPKGTGADWFEIGQAVAELIPDFPEGTPQIERGCAKAEAIRSVAEKHRRVSKKGPVSISERTVRNLFDIYEAAMAEHDRIAREEDAADQR
jgi:hypothetical protein